MVLEVAGRMRNVIERDAPIEFESGSVSGQYVPADAETDAGERLRSRCAVPRQPGPSDVDELRKLNHVFAAGKLEQGNPAFKGGDKSIVTDQRIFPVAAHAEAPPQRDLFERKQPVVAELEIQPS